MDCGDEGVVAEEGEDMIFPLSLTSFFFTGDYDTLQLKLCYLKNTDGLPITASPVQS